MFLAQCLLERCEPGVMLQSAPEVEQDVIVATLLKRLWRRPPAPYVFRPLSVMLDYWRNETLAQAPHRPDAGLVREGLGTLESLSKHAPTDVLLATDLHTGNVLRSRREPWLAIDPKPFVGETAYDLTPHPIVSKTRLHADPAGFVERLADLAEVDHDRVRLWTFARAAADPREDWSDNKWMNVARVGTLERR